MPDPHSLVSCQCDPWSSPPPSGQRGTGVGVACLGSIIPYIFSLEYTLIIWTVRHTSFDSWLSTWPSAESWLLPPLMHALRESFLSVLSVVMHTPDRHNFPPMRLLVVGCCKVVAWPPYCVSHELTNKPRLDYTSRQIIREVPY